MVTTDDIHACHPDFVVATHEYTPKLTPFFTIGAMWNPPAFFSNDPRRVKSVLSYDAYLIGSAKVGRFLDALEFSSGSRKPRSDFFFLPTALETTHHPRPRDEPRSLAYVGVHWDGLRHGGLLKILSDRAQINIYGPANSWRDFPESYRGSIPFDGSAVADTLRNHGIALCIHREEHRLSDTPSMRLFEAAAAGCLIIADNLPFARRVLGDSAFYIDMNAPAKHNAQRVGEIVQWASENPDLAEAMATRSHEVLARDYSVESMVRKCCDFAASAQATVADERRQAASWFHVAAPNATSTSQPPLVDVIVRTGGREISKLRRALRAISDQTDGTYRVLLVDYKGREDVRKCAIEETSSRLSIKYLNCPDTGWRSTALWHGLKHVEAPFFAMLDDDDTVMPHHFGALLQTSKNFPDHVLWYSGSILEEEGSGLYMNAVNFAGPMETHIQERRELKFIDAFNLSRLVKNENYILTNSWIARTSALDDRALDDPEMEVAEDVYLYLMLLRKGPFKLCPTPSACWHFRTASKDNSMFGVSVSSWAEETTKMRIRVSQDYLYNGFSFADMEHLLDVAPPNTMATIPVRPRMLVAGKEARFDGELVLGSRHFNFHGPESTGIWTSAINASIHVHLAKPERKITVRLGFQPAASVLKGSQQVRISINGIAIFSKKVDGWSVYAIEADLDLPAETGVLFINVRCAYVMSLAEEGSGTDTRSLGVFLSDIAYIPLQSEGSGADAVLQSQAVSSPA